jgi:hypothetical protein
MQDADFDREECSYNASRSLSTVSVTLTKLSSNSFLVVFSSVLRRDLGAADLALSVPGSKEDFSYSVTKLTEYSYEVCIAASRAVREVQLTFTNSSFLLSASNELLGSYRVVLAGETSSLDNYRTISKHVARAGSVFFITASLFSNDLAPAFSFVNHFLFTVYLPLLHLDFPEEFVAICNGFVYYLPFPNLLTLQADSTTSTLSAQAGLTSAVFLDNAGRQLMTGAVLVSNLVLVCVLSFTRLSLNLGCSEHLSIRRCVNLILNWLTFAFLELSVAVGIQLSHSSFDSPYLKVNFSLACAGAVCIVIVPALLCYLAIKYTPSSEEQEETDHVPVFFSNWSCWFGEFRTHWEALGNCYYVLYYTKRIGLVLSACLLRNKEHQLVVNISTCALSLVHLYVYQPFKSKLLNYSAMYAEGCLVVFMATLHINKAPVYRLVLVISVFSGSLNYLGIQLLKVHEVLSELLKASVPAAESDNATEQCLFSPRAIALE